LRASLEAPIEAARVAAAIIESTSPVARVSVEAWLKPLLAPTARPVAAEPVAVASRSADSAEDRAPPEELKWAPTAASFRPERQRSSSWPDRTSPLDSLR